MMGVLVINGSPRRSRSVTLRLAMAFVEGMGAPAEVVETSGAGIEPCRACFSCWYRTPGRCVQRDAGAEILEKLKACDAVIWAIPLFSYSAPSECKALMDRMVSLIDPKLIVGEDGLSRHPGYEDGSKPAVLISSAGQPDVKGNFDALVFQLRRMFGQNTQTVLCAEGPLFFLKGNERWTEPYLAAVRRAGAEFAACGRIPEEIQRVLDSLMMPRDEFIRYMNRE